MIEATIANMTELCLIGIKEHIDGDISQRQDKVKALWERLKADGTLDRLKLMQSGEPGGMLGASYSFSNSGFDYFIGVVAQECAQGFETLTLEEGEYAVFDAPDAEDVVAAWKLVYFDWFSKAPYVHTGKAELEQRTEDGVKLYVPIAPKPARKPLSKGKAMRSMPFILGGMFLGVVIASLLNLNVLLMLLGGMMVGGVVAATIYKDKK
ncbi:MAG: effector binding domain-containing protein [Clostridia bacterium]